MCLVLKRQIAAAPPAQLASPAAAAALQKMLPGWAC
jgi:hypothetical protein